MNKLNYWIEIWHIASLHLQQVTTLSILVRLIMAVFLGGVIGLERGANKQAAGFRTHILVCVGAAMAMLTNQFVCETMASTSDPTRLGAQVITGVGFLGVGTILVTGKHKIKGLTTAAGLWASACIGLAIGIGFYMGAIIASLLVYISLALLPKLEHRVYQQSRAMDIYLEINDIYHLKNLVYQIRSQDIIVHETNISRSEIGPEGFIGLHLCLRLPKGKNRYEILEELESAEGVYLAEEI